MSTYMEIARSGRSHRDFASVSDQEGVRPNAVIDSVASGSLVIVPGRGSVLPVGLGHVASSKVLCNMGTSSDSPDIAVEIEKAQIAIDHGARIVCDQSVGPDLPAHRSRLVETLKVPIAAIPLYQNAQDSVAKTGDPLNFTPEEVLDVFRQQVLQGVTMPGFHTMSRRIVELLRTSRRLLPLVSRGGGLLHEWIVRNNGENPYLERYDEVLEIARSHNVPLTLVCSLRSGSVADGYDSEQRFEWKTLKALVRRAKNAGVSIMVDGLGHMRIDEIATAVRGFKQTCGEVPLGVLGPAVTDRALGHEQVANGIGTALAVWNGAYYCNACYSTEHLGLPEIGDIPAGIGAAIVATYAGDLARGQRRAQLLEKEVLMSEARKRNRWGAMLDYAIEKVEARRTFRRVGAKNKDGAGCSVCGDL
ncbi:MAG: phosphomethylpyrimidine synthase ThiC, partial [Candidatus Eisenbacteria bacterium]|nr:phosphomethylpyrimidine synthase ThiC [Candidatus Eisenbacteria bacterium]